MKKAFLWLLAIVLAATAAWAALDLGEIGVGARPLGMGKAYIGLADDASAIFTNPAGLSRNKYLNIVSMSGAMLGDVNYILFGVSENSPLGKFGIGYVSAATGSIPLTTLVGSGPSLEARQYALADYSTSQIYLSYGSKLSRFLRNGIGDNISLGLSLKFFLQGFSGGDVTPSGGANPLTDARGDGRDADLGLLWETNRWMTLGLTFQNFLPSSFGGTFDWKKDGLSDEGIPMVIKTGGDFRILGPTALMANESQSLNLLLDYECSYTLNRPSVYHLGVEYQPLSAIALRAGIDQKPKATEGGISVDSNLTAGVGICFSGFTFDYAYHRFGELSENTTHFFSFGYRGEDRLEEKEKERARKLKRPTIPLPEIVAKPALKAFPDVPEGFWARKPIEYLATLNIMDGYDDGEFKPMKPINRGELAVLLVKAKGFSVGKEVRVRFKDVPLQSYEAPYVSLAVERRYINGYPDKTFRPEKNISRAEAAAVLARFSGLYTKQKVREKVFPDLPVKHWASPAVAATKETGLFEYLSGQDFRPKEFLTRAEAAEIISKTPFAKSGIEKLISGGEK